MPVTALSLPERARKPRTAGLTMVVDGGLPIRYFADLVGSNSEYLDYCKFGWGTALVTHQLEAKISVLRRHGVGFYLGGTLLEKYILQDRFDDFRELCHQIGATHVEVSNGTIPISNSEKAAYIHKLADEFTVISEVGFKDPARCEELSAGQWVEFIKQDLDAGASLVTTEARESGHAGICSADGVLRVDLIEQVLGCGVPSELLLFEAPTTELQAYFVRRVGPDVNLGNVAPAAVLALETLRLGLRADTLLALEPATGGSVR